MKNTVLCIQLPHQMSLSTKNPSKPLKYEKNRYPKEKYPTHGQKVYVIGDNAIGDVLMRRSAAESNRYHYARVYAKGEGLTAALWEGLRLLLAQQNQGCWIL